MTKIIPITNLTRGFATTWYCAICNKSISRCVTTRFRIIGWITTVIVNGARAIPTIGMITYQTSIAALPAELIALANSLIDMSIAHIPEEKLNAGTNITNNPVTFRRTDPRGRSPSKLAVTESSRGVNALKSCSVVLLRATVRNSMMPRNNIRKNPAPRYRSVGSDSNTIDSVLTSLSIGLARKANIVLEPISSSPSVHVAMPVLSSCSKPQIPFNPTDAICIFPCSTGSRLQLYRDCLV